MNDIRIPDWQSRGRGFVSLILQTTFTLSVIKDCDDIEDDRKNNFKKKKYIYLKP
jgi:hypothetical protein